MSYRECTDKSHRRQHDQAVTLVNLDAEIARDVFENHVSLNMVQEQEGENFEVEVILLGGTPHGADEQVNDADGEQVIKVGEERVFEFAVLAKGLGHFGPVAGEVFKEMSVSLEFATLESKTLEVADGEECRNREQRKRYEECGCLGAFAVQNLGQGKHDKGEQAEDGFLAGLGKEG